jgi:polyhydroxyalkanoate synthase
VNKQAEQTKKEYQNMVQQSVTKQYTEADRQRLGMEPVKQTPVYRQACWTLSRCLPVVESKHSPVLVVPSLINRNYIMNLLPGHSLIEAMKNAGLDVFVLDWGTPDEGHGQVGFDHYIGTWLRRAVRHVKKITGSAKIQLAGQCIGGLMAALYAAHPVLKKDLASLYLLTAPLDLADSGMLADWTSTDGFDIEKMTSAFQGVVPADFFHASFPFLDVNKQLTKYKTLEQHFAIPGFKEIWQSLDIWANDNVCFAKQAFIELIREFYQKNAFYQDGFTIRGEKVRVADISTPTIALVAEEDHVFTENAAHAILESAAAKKGWVDYHVLPAGHVTLVAAHPVRETTFRLTTQFLQKF